MELTEQGNTQIPEVVEVLLKYLDLIRAPGGINEQVWLTALSQQYSGTAMMLGGGFSLACPVFVVAVR